MAEKTEIARVWPPNDSHTYEPGVLLITPCTDRPHVLTADVIARLQYLHNWQRLPVNGSIGVHKVRSQAASMAIMGSADWFVWIDDDTICSAPDVLRLVETATAHDLDALAAVVPVRRGMCRPNFLPEPRNARLLLGEGGGPIPAHSLGLALAVIHRRVFERMIEAKAVEPAKYVDGSSLRVFDGFGFFSPILSDGEDRGEDYSFCKRARESGSELWVDTSMVCLHPSEVLLGLEEMVQGMRELNAGTRRKDLVVLCPQYDPPETETRALMDELEQNGTPVIECSERHHGIDRIRSGMASMALLDPEIQWVGWLDSDMIAEPDVFHQLIKSAEEQRAEYMCAVYADRHTGRCLNFKPHPDLWHGEEISFGKERGGCIPILYVAGGVSVCHRKAYERIAPRCEEAVYRMNGKSFEGRAYYQGRVCNREHMGEDYAFADLLTSMGGLAMVDTRILAGHIGRKIHTVQSALEAMAAVRAAE